jgi:hypothetical protein
MKVKVKKIGGSSLIIICFAKILSFFVIICCWNLVQVKEVPIFHVYEVYRNQGMLLKSHMCAHLFVCMFMLGPIIFAINLTTFFGFEFYLISTQLVKLV